MASKLNRLLCIVLLMTVFVNLKNVSEAYMVGDDPHHRVEVLDSKGKYQLEWKVDWSLKRIIFSVRVETKGYLGFGLSRNGKMSGADIVIGGVMPNGQVYFSDYHAIANQKPIQDGSQDWTLIEAHETDTHTILKFSRNVDTCDSHDYPITEDKISLIWAFGERDIEISYHHRNRGEYPVYLLHPDYTPPFVQDPHVGDYHHSNSISSSSSAIIAQNKLKVWTVNTRMVIPSSDTTYWCTMHQAPAHSQKQHVVGFEVRFANEQSRSKVHHLLMHKCHAPLGRDAQQMFASYLHHRGQACFSVKAPQGPMPTEYCTEFVQVWAKGGRPYFYPPHVGFSLGDYYMLQIHYDNVAMESNVEVDLSIDYYYSSQLRANEGAMINVRHETPGVTPSLLVPPSSVDHMAYGICGSQCTQEFMPSEGIRVFGLLLHSHNTGAAIRVHQIRGNKELPWIQSDDNYDFNFQQLRVANREAKVLPADFLAIRCTYDNTRVNGTVVGGYSSQQEMCSTFLHYYNKIEGYVMCSSEIESDEARRTFLGIGNVTWSNRDIEFIVEEPERYAGLKVSEVSDKFVNWNMERRENYQRYILEAPHVSRCPQERYSLSPSAGYRKLSSGRSENEEDTRLRFASYPHDAIPYQPEDVHCNE